ncbi:uncharacterized protein LOC109579598 [Bactrocera dorsalis]|uniref:Uncharacterized protein LOC109579598 n=1 Tax=Bactrocera dorsalis TaxID=27457 RepID=A0ABM3J1C6_BACDO|nr:uncharacterized protein LOC109579598 [Bactrocera dorsalis]
MEKYGWRRESNNKWANTPGGTHENGNPLIVLAVAGSWILEARTPLADERESSEFSDSFMKLILSSTSHKLVFRIDMARFEWGALRLTINSVEEVAAIRSRAIGNFSFSFLETVGGWTHFLFPTVHFRIVHRQVATAPPSVSCPPLERRVREDSALEKETETDAEMIAWSELPPSQEDKLLINPESKICE